MTLPRACVLASVLATHAAVAQQAEQAVTPPDGTPGRDAPGSGNAGTPRRDAPGSGSAGKVFKSQSDWVLQVEPSAWYAAPGGELRLPGGGQKMGFEELNLDSPRWSPTLELNIRDGRWRFVFGASHVAADDRGVIAEDAGRIGGLSFDAGDPLSSSLDYTTVEMSAGYNFFRRKLSERKKGGFNYVAAAEVLGGVRLHDVSFDVRGPAGTASADEFFAEPFAGVRFGVDLAENFSIDVVTSLGAFSDGGNREAFSWDTVAGFQWYPARNIAVEIGYRQLALSLSSGSGAGEFEWTGATAGLFGGLSIRY
jgi:opacity protein-like surface antigen